MKSPHCSFNNLDLCLQSDLTFSRMKAVVESYLKPILQMHSLTRHLAAFCNKDDLVLSRTCFICYSSTVEVFLFHNRKEAGLIDIYSYMHLVLSCPTKQPKVQLIEFYPQHYRYSDNTGYHSLFHFNSFIRRVLATSQL